MLLPLFNVEAANDTMWGYGIVWDLCRAGLPSLKGFFKTKTVNAHTMWGADQQTLD